MRIHLIHLLFIFSATAVLASPNVEEVALPTVTAADFTPGRQWTWDYFDPAGKIYSTERYTVIDQRGSIVLIELSSDYDGRQELNPSHRLRVDVARCLEAYRNPFQKQPWRFEMFYLSKSASGAATWTEIDPPNTLAFEEKFNCNPREYLKPSAPYRTVYKDIVGETVFMQKLWRRIVSSWYLMNGTNRAVAASKDFSTEPRENYSFRLRSN